MSLNDFSQTPQVQAKFSCLNRYSDLFQRMGQKNIFFDGVLWTSYQRMIVPVGSVSCDYGVSADKHRRGLFGFFKTCVLIRAGNGFVPTPEIWYSVLCDRQVTLSDLSSDTRSKVRRGLKHCVVRKVDASFVAQYAWPVYSAAFSRYSNSSLKKTERQFKKEVFLTSDFEDIVDYWGVFEKRTGQLIAYTKNYLYQNIEANYWTIRFHPEFLRLYSSYALFYEMNRHYLGERKFVYVNDGFRSLLHETNIQDYLINKFLFRKQAIGLSLYYQPCFGLGMKLSYPVRKLIRRTYAPLDALYTLEEINRQTQEGCERARMVDVVVTYGWNRVAYNMLRALTSHGVRVAIGDTATTAMAKKSRYCSETFQYRSFYTRPQDFVGDLETVFRRLRPKVYLPSHEETFVVARYIDRLRKTGVKIPIADFDLLRTLHRKDLMAVVAQKLGIPTPKTVKLKSLSELGRVWEEAGQGGCVVVKALNTNSSKGVFYARSLEELKTICGGIIRGLAKENYPIVQEYVEGAGYGVSMLFNHGVLKAKFTHKRLREKLSTGGTSTVRISTENAELERLAEKLLGSMKWHGVAMVEFKYNESTKRGWLIEVNPRFWGSLALAIHSGVNFPYLLYKMALDEEFVPVFDYKKGVVSRWILGDVLAALDCLKNRQKMFNVMDFTGENINYDDLYKDDPGPFFAQCGYYAMKFLSNFKINPTEEAILDIDRI